MVSWHTTFSENLSCSKIKSTFVMTPHGFKGLIPQEGGSMFWGNIRHILMTHVSIRKRWQVWDEVLALRLSWSLKLKLQSRQHRKMVRINVETAINSALSNQFATRRKYVINLLWVCSRRWKSRRSGEYPFSETKILQCWDGAPCRMTVGGLCSHLECHYPRGLVLCHPVFCCCMWQHWSRRSSSLYAGLKSKVVLWRWENPWENPPHDVIMTSSYE